MSAFIVSHETLNRAVTLFDRNGRLASQDLDDLGKRLWAMNAEAVFQRYREPQEVPPEFCYRLYTYAPVVALKALQCLIYQCSEGDVPESDLYQELREKERAVTAEIVRNLPEYEAAKWDA